MAKYLDSNGLSHFMSKIKEYIDDIIAGEGGVLGIDHGGTGATTAATALSNLGAASLSALNQVRDALSQYLPLTGGTVTGDLRIEDGVIDRDAANPSSDQWGSGYRLYDKDGELLGYYGVVRRTNGRIQTLISTVNELSDGTQAQANAFYVGVEKDGTRHYQVSDAAKFRSDLGITPANIGAAVASHGNHVPTTQTADNATYLRNDNTWHKITPANIGAAAASHGNHVPATQTASNKVFLRNDNTWQTVTPANIGALALSGGTVSGNITFKDGSFARNTTPGTSDHWAPGVVIYDKNGDNFGQVRVIRRTSGRNDLSLGVYGADGTSNYLNIGMNSDGTRYYSVSDAAKFRSAISAASSTHTHAIGRSIWSEVSASVSITQNSMVSLDTPYTVPDGKYLTGCYGCITNNTKFFMTGFDHNSVYLYNFGSTGNCTVTKRFAAIKSPLD